MNSSKHWNLATQCFIVFYNLMYHASSQARKLVLVVKMPTSLVQALKKIQNLCTAFWMRCSCCETWIFQNVHFVVYVGGLFLSSCHVTVLALRLCHIINQRSFRWQRHASLQKRVNIAWEKTSLNKIVFQPSFLWTATVVYYYLDNVH